MRQYWRFSLIAFVFLSILPFYSCSFARQPDIYPFEIGKSGEKGKLSKTKTSVAVYTANGIEFTFRNVKKDYIQGKTSFYDIWQLWEAFGCNENGDREANIIRPGEWETALKINDDFVGGINHGFERKTFVQFVLDGKSILEDENIALRPFKSFYVVQVSDIYAFDSTVDRIAVITKKWDFKNDGEIKFNQTIKWLSKQQLSNSYLTMLPVARGDKEVNITSKATRDDIEEVFDVSYEGHKNLLGPAGRNKQASVMRLWGEIYEL